MLTRRLLPIAFVGLASPSFAGELIVEISNVESAVGEVGCALHSENGPFPTGKADIEAIWQAADPNGVRCRFTDLPAGDYAVAASHDLNGNRETDTNFLGIPREDWGVSNNVRPTLRAPTFDEARVTVADGGVTEIDVELGR